jgi:hypothetical protein
MRRAAAKSITMGGSVLALCFLSSVGLAGPTSRSAGVGEAPRAFVDAPAGDSKDTAPAEVKAEIIVLHATNDGKGIDPSIGKMPELGKPPFSSFDSYKLLEKFELKLKKSDVQSHGLPDGGKLALTYKDFVKSKKKDEGSKFVLATSIDKPDGTSFLDLNVTALEGSYFFVAGQKFGKDKEKGILVIGIKVK